MAVKRKGLSVNNLPTVPSLKLALVALVDNRVVEIRDRLKTTGDKLSRWAAIARDSSRTECFFCGEPSAPPMKKPEKLSWGALPICKCLYPLRTKYVEYYKDWAQHLPEIAAGVNSNEVNPATIIYSDNCIDCTRPFFITAEIIMSTFEYRHSHRQMRRCSECAGRVKAERLRQKAVQRPASSNSEQPHPKKKYPPRHPGKLTGAKMGPDVNAVKKDVG